MISLSKITSKLTTGFKYGYLIAFFALLAGFFYPLITNSSFGSVIIGVIILFVGLAGGALLYKAANEKRSIMFLSGGFGLITISLFFIFQLTGRI
jgi:hypothetical protein